MKSKVYLIIFAIAFGFTAINTEAKTSENSKSGNNNKTVARVNALQKDFELYINEQYTPFTEQDEWKVFVEVVTYYNNDPSKFLNVNAEKQKQFKGAVSLLSHALSTGNDANAKAWLSHLKKTSHNIHFLWNLDWNGLTPIEEVENPGEPIPLLNGF
ncbi:MAG: hypothetical protein U0X91_26415 [Spirosomataceae bacterium]